MKHITLYENFLNEAINVEKANISQLNGEWKRICSYLRNNTLMNADGRNKISLIEDLEEKLNELKRIIELEKGLKGKSTLSEKIVKFLNSSCTGTWKELPDGEISLGGSLHIRDEHLKILPVKFAKITNDIFLNFCGLDTLYGLPPACKKLEIQSANSLKSLEGSPIVSKSFTLGKSSELTSLKGLKLGENIEEVRIYKDSNISDEEQTLFGVAGNWSWHLEPDDIVILKKFLDSGKDILTWKKENRGMLSAKSFNI